MVMPPSTETNKGASPCQEPLVLLMALSIKTMGAMGPRTLDLVRDGPNAHGLPPSTFVGGSTDLSSRCRYMLRLSCCMSPVGGGIGVSARSHPSRVMSMADHAVTEYTYN